MYKFELSSIQNTVLSLKPSKAIYSLLMVLFVSITPLVSYGQSPQIFNTSGTFTIAAGVTSITVEAWGGGAGGKDGGTGAGSDGGGGGGYAKSTFAVNSGFSYDYIVGVGGTANNNGENSSFESTLLVASGGVSGGLGGTVNIGTITFDGGSAGNSTSNKIKGGSGGGSAAGSNQNGNNGSNATGDSGSGGGAATSGGGAGGAGGKDGKKGSNGDNPGGGGGGGGKQDIGGIGGKGQVIISWTCPTYSITSVSTTSACKTSNTANVTLAANATSLPVGSYTVTYSLGYNSNSTSYTAPMTVTAAGSGTFTANVSIVNATSNTTIRVNKLTSAGCSATITANNVSNVSYMYPAANATTITNIYATCTSYIIQWDNKTMDKYFLDVATDSGFTNYVPGYQNKDMGNVISHEFVGLTNGATYYCRVRSNNYCGTSVNSNVYTFTKVGYNSIAAISGGATSVCTGSVTPAFTNSDSGGTWSIVNETGSASITSGGVVTGISAGIVKIVYTKKFSGCTSSVTKFITVNGATITPNKVDETCPSSNNGSISPLLSGGLTNIRYIKLTQKYAVDAYQQVAEIQAFEIFTGTNVALSTTGAVASASSVWTNSVGPNYIPSNVNNGVTDGNTFWHGATSNLNEWVKIDLQSAKNIDNLKIYNRTDCCSERGQNMLLELFDDSNNLVYSKTVDLYQSGANVIKVNVLDVSWADGATNLNRTALDSGTYILKYTDVLGCSVVNYPITIAATNASPSIPTIGAQVQPDCKTSTGSVVLSGLPESGTINQTGTVVKSYTITGTTMLITGLTAGTYNFTSSNGSCSSTPTGNVVFNAAVTNTWTTSWSNGTPNNTQKLVFTGIYPPAVDPNLDTAGCSCTVTGGAEVTIKSGKTLTITNEVTVLGGGKLTFENSSSLLQINTVTNLGNIIYKRDASAPTTSNYTYWSSPVASQTLNLSPYYKLGNFYSFDNSTEAWTSATLATTMLVGQGYIAKGPILTQLGLFTATFTGVPNNGPQSVSVPGGGKSILLGNPYPSAIDAKAFIAANPAVIDGTLYFWTHITGTQLASTIGNNADGTPKAGSGANAYTQDDYAVFNSTGGTKANNGGVVPSGFIAAGQSFFTTSSSAGGLVKFSNAMRVVGGATLADGSIVNGQFFKTRNVAKTINASEKHRVWLDLSNNKGAFKQTLIGYITDATNDYDSRFDGESFDSNEFVDFYSTNQDKNLVIQGRALPFDENDEVPLGYRTTINGEFTINIDQTDGLLANQPVFIEDKLTNTVFDLKEGNYTFNTVAGTFDDRFVLRYTNKTLSVDETNKEDGILVLYSNNYKTLIIHNNDMDSTVNSVTLFNITGQNIANWEVNDFEQTNIQFPIKNISSGVYIVKVKTTKGESSKKIIVRE